MVQAMARVRPISTDRPQGHLVRGHRPGRRAAALTATAAFCAAASLGASRAIGRTLSGNGRCSSSGHSACSQTADVVEMPMVISQEPIGLYSDGLEERPLDLFREKLAGAFSSPEWRLCAVSGGSCECTGTAALHTVTADWAMLRHVNRSILCSADVFGADPRPGMPKICSCRPGIAWPDTVQEGVNSTIALRLVPRVEVGPPGAGCDPEGDGLWTPCSVMSMRYDASFVPDRFLPRLPPSEQKDAALRRLDECYRIGGPDRALRVLGVASTAPPMVPLKVTKVPMCAVVYEPEAGPAWRGRQSVFCPTDPPHCLEDSCECADEAHMRTNIQTEEDGPACWACGPPPPPPDEEEKSDVAKGQPAPKATPVSRARAQPPRTVDTARKQVTPVAVATERR